MKRVIVISTSLRRGSNSDMLANQFVEGAKTAGNEVEKISLVGKNIQFCKGCLACQKLDRCVINDDVNDIMAKVLKADVVVWATPIYYYEMSGQMKTLIDRMNAMYSQDYAFRDVYLLTTAAENEEQTPKRAEIGFGIEYVFSAVKLSFSPRTHTVDFLIVVESFFIFLPNCKKH